jgi:hypothetical protein
MGYAIAEILDSRGKMVVVPSQRATVPRARRASAVARWDLHPLERAAFSRRAQRGHRKGQPAGGISYYRRPDRSATFCSPANFPPACMLLQNHQAFLWSKPKNTLVSLHSK